MVLVLNWINHKLKGYYSTKVRWSW